MKSFKKVLPLLIGALAGGALGFLATSSLMQFLKPILDQISASWLFLFLPLSAFLAVLLHESGHVLAGLSAGFRFHMMTVLFLKLEKTGDKLAIRWNSQLNSWGGLAILFPKTQTNRPAYAWFIAGGPLASILTGAVSAVLFLLFSESSPVFGLFAACMLLLNGAIALVTILPLPLDTSLDTDGKQFLDLLRGGDYAERKLAMGHVLTESTGGKRPSELTETWMDVMERGEKIDRTTLISWMIRVNMEMDRDDWDRAAVRMNAIFEQEALIPPIVNRTLYLQMAIIEAFRNNGAEATRWIERAGSKGYAEASWVALAQAAEAHVHGRTNDSKKYAMEGIAKIKETMDPGSAKMTERLLNTFI